jgi:hypothetical protein
LKATASQASKQAKLPSFLPSVTAGLPVCLLLLLLPASGQVSNKQTQRQKSTHTHGYWSFLHPQDQLLESLSISLSLFAC